MGYGRSVDRRDPAATADERSTLEQFLDFQRATLLWKADGLTDEQLAMTTAASTLTLGGLLKHAALVEDHWFSVMLLGADAAEPFRDVDWSADPDWEFRTARLDTGAYLRQLYE